MSLSLLLLMLECLSPEAGNGGKGAKKMELDFQPFHPVLMLPGTINLLFGKDMFFISK